MAEVGKGYKEEIEAFLASDQIIITGNPLDRASVKQISFLYNRFTGGHEKKFLKPDTLAYKLSQMAEKGDTVWGPDEYTGYFWGMASGDREWFEKGKKRIKEWLLENGGKTIHTPERYFKCRLQINCLIGAYNEWDKGERPFKFEQELYAEQEYWSFRKALGELGYSLNEKAGECSIYDKDGEEVAEWL